VKVWLVIFLGGLMTFGMRFSLIFLFGKFEIPDSLRRALHYVPPAVLSAIVFPELFYPAGAFSISLDNSRLLAGAAAILAAWASKSALLAIFTGIMVLLVLQAL
jgi:branched-subunit amino acid transport protein